MFRVANAVMIVALLVTAAVVYQLKVSSTAEAERLATLRTQIRKERDSIALMRAEWARRTSPIYIQGLAERHLDMKRLDVDSISSLDDLPAKPASGGDGIGGMIEALVDAPLVTSSAGSKPSASTTAPTSSGGATVPATSALRPANAPVSKPAASASAASRPPVARPLPPMQPAPAAAAPAPAPPPEPTNPLEKLSGFLAGFR
ncbi:cell division protein FtsL [Xanthobacter flavus]|uniref:cell division protein FtsL n=1 Tax=Xanthobacter flavus TaxID=281 RepID=UPI0037280C1D